MSKFSGKCDIYDVLIMMSDSIEDIEDRIAKTEFYIYTTDYKKHKLDIRNYHDLIPYFPYIEVAGMHSKDESVVVLSSRSFVDIEEEEILTNNLDSLKRYYKKCKRNKMKFIPEEALSHITVFYKNKDYKYELAKRVKELGLKATTERIHTDMHERYRKLLYKCMVENGYSEFHAYNWCFNEFFGINNDRLGENDEDD